MTDYSEKSRNLLSKILNEINTTHYKLDTKDGKAVMKNIHEHLSKNGKLHQNLLVMIKNFMIFLLIQLWMFVLI